MSVSLVARGPSNVRMRFKPGLVGLQGSPGYPLNTRTIDARAFGATDVTPGTNWTTQVQAALDASVNGSTVILPSVPWRCDGLIMPEREDVTIIASGPIIWSGTPLAQSKRTNSATGIVYPPALLTVFGGTRHCTFALSTLDGWNKGVHGLYLSAGNSCRYDIGRIRYSDVAVNQDIHESNGADCVFNVNLVEYVNTVRRNASGTLYAADPTKYQWISTSHHSEGTYFYLGFALYYKDYGLLREQRIVKTAANTPVAGQTTYYVSGTTCFDDITATLDAFSYYNFSGSKGGYSPDPVGSSNSIWYGGATPITDAPASDGTGSYYSGFTRPSGILTKSASEKGAQDICDLFAGSTTIPVGGWFNGSQVTGSDLIIPWKSKSKYTLPWNGNTIGFLLNNAGPTGNTASPGLESCFIHSSYQELAVFGRDVVIDFANKTVTANGLFTQGTVQGATVRAALLAGATGNQLLNIGSNPGTGALSLVGQAGSLPPYLSSPGDMILRAGGGGTFNFNFPISLTVGAAGTAAALPANPNRYLTVKDENGNLLKIPAYNP